MSSAPAASVTPRQEGVSFRLRDFFLRNTPLVGTVATTLASMITSLALTLAGSLVLLPHGSPVFWAMLAIGLTIPLLVAPPAAWTVIHLAHELAAARRVVEQLAIVDVPTGVFTRRHFDDIGSREFERAQRSDLPLTLLMLDLDDFKQINDRHGHIIGDAVLQAVGKACLGNVRPYDIVARYGGEELVVLLTATADAGAATLAERLRCAIAALSIATPHGQVVTPTASIGVAARDASTPTLEALVARADAAMYEAKRAGKNRVMPG